MEATKQFIITINSNIMKLQKGDVHFNGQSNGPYQFQKATVELVSNLISIVIDFEGMLFTSGLAFNNAWNAQRKRLKWRALLKTAKTLSQISLGVRYHHHHHHHYYYCYYYYFNKYIE